MLYVIKDRNGKPQLIVQKGYKDDEAEIKETIRAEIELTNGVDISNIADTLHERGYTIFGFREIQIP